MGVENRRHKRVPSDFFVKAILTVGEVDLQGTCRNLSLDGAFIEMKEPPRPGVVIHLLLELKPIGKTIGIDAEVVWGRPPMPDKQFPPGVGVKFKRPNEETRRLLLETLERLQRRSVED